MFSVNDAIEKYLGAEYQFKGRTKVLDCYGLVISVYKDLGLSIPDIRVDDDEKWAAHGKSVDLCGLPELFTSVPIPKCFDVVAFTNHRSVVNHAGVYIGGGQFIHATKTAGVCVSHLHDKKWEGRLAGIYRHRDLI